MNRVNTVLPDNRHWLREIVEVPPNASSGYDYVGPAPPAGRRQSQDGFFSAGVRDRLVVGSVLIDCMRNRKDVGIQILLPNGEWYVAPRRYTGNDWASLMRGYIRSWLSLTRPGRCLRAIKESIAELQRTDWNAEELVQTQDFIYTLEKMAAAILGEYSGTTNADILKAFQTWLTEVADRHNLPEADVMVILNQGVQKDDASDEETDTSDLVVNQGLQANRRFSRAIEI